MSSLGQTTSHQSLKLLRFKPLVAVISSSRLLLIWVKSLSALSPWMVPRVSFVEGSPTMVPVGTTMLGHTVEGLETGIKVIDLLAPCAHGGKIGLFGGAGAGETVDSGTHQQRCQSPWQLLYFLRFVSFKPLFLWFSTSHTRCWRADSWGLRSVPQNNWLTSSSIPPWRHAGFAYDADYYT